MATKKEHWLVKCENGETFVRRTKSLALRFACEIILQEIADWAAKSCEKEELAPTRRFIELGEYDAAVNEWRVFVNNGLDGKGEVIVCRPSDEG